jgi:hypothetical protein
VGGEFIRAVPRKALALRPRVRGSHGSPGVRAPGRRGGALVRCVAPVVIVSPRVLAGRLASQEMVGRDEHGVRHRDDGFLVAAMRHDAPIAGGEGAFGGPDAGREGGLDQGGAEPAIAMAGALLAEELAVPGEIAEFPNRGGGHKAGADEAVLEQLSDPDRVVDVGFPVGDLGGLAGVGRDTRARLLQDVEHWRQ